MKFFKQHRTQTVLLFFVVIILMSACATTSFKSSPDLTLRRETEKILLMPMDIQLSILTAGGILKPEAAWTINAKKYVVDAIKEKMRQIGVYLRVPIDEELILDDEKEKQLQLMKLNEAVGNSILVHQYMPAFKLPGKEDRFDWSLGPSSRLLKEKNEADYALFVYLRDSYASAGRVAAFVVAAAFGVGIPMGQQVGFASLVDLETGNVVWFNRLVQGAGDLRTRDDAANSVKILLSDFPQ
jgi:hypothetical protein